METLLWKRYPKGYSEGFGNLHVVHGHDNHPDGPLLYEGRTNLDTLAWRTGRLTIGVFDDERRVARSISSSSRELRPGVNELTVRSAVSTGMSLKAVVKKK